MTSELFRVALYILYTGEYFPLSWRNFLDGFENSTQSIGIYRLYKNDSIFDSGIQP